MKLERLPVSDKITVLCQTNYASKASYQSLQTTITEQVCKNHTFYLIQSSSSLSILSSFCSVALSFIASTFLSSYFSLMFLSIWWRYPTFEFWYISPRHSSFNQFQILEKVLKFAEQFSDLKNVWTVELKSVRMVKSLSAFSLFQSYIKWLISDVFFFVVKSYSISLVAKTFNNRICSYVRTAPSLLYVCSASWTMFESWAELFKAGLREPRVLRDLNSDLKA